MKIFYLLSITLLVSTIWATNHLVSNIAVSQRTNGSKIVDISYGLEETNNHLAHIEIFISDDDGNSYNILPDSNFLSGDIGNNISVGTGKSITWNAGAENDDFDGNNYRIKIIANENPTPSVPLGFVFIAGGSYAMGDAYDEGLSHELPIHNVSINSFFIAECELSQAEYEAVSNNNPAHTYGVGDNYPVYYVTWYDAIIFCNNKSLMEGLTPCYTVNNVTDPTNWPSIFSPSCNWTASGYRLPTEAEWEYAARAGINSSDNWRYSSCNTKTELLNHAWYSNNNTPYGTKEIREKSANSQGLYDMSGNIGEWCWDWFSSDYYQTCSPDNPRGATSGTIKIVKGGYWGQAASSCRVAFRSASLPQDSGGSFGFRLVRSAN